MSTWQDVLMMMILMRCGCFLKNAITQTAGTILNRIERVTYKDWFDAECEQATISKNKAHKSTQQRNHTRKAAEEYRTATREKKEYYMKCYMKLN